MDVAVSPDNRLNLQNLGKAGDRGFTGWVWRGNLRIPGDLAPAVDSSGEAVVAPQRGQRGDHALLPEEMETYKVRTEHAKLLPQRVWSTSFGSAADVIALVRSPSCNAVGASQCAEVGHNTIPPQEAVRGCIAGQRRIAFDCAAVIDAPGQAKRSAERAEVCDGVYSVLRGQLKRHCKRDDKYRLRDKCQFSGFHVFASSCVGTWSRGADSVVRLGPANLDTTDWEVT